MKRVELILKSPTYAKYIAQNIAAEENHRFCKHDLAHMIDVARITYILILEHQDLNYFMQSSGLAGPLAAKEIIYAAGLLHDIGKWKEYESGVDHATFGADLAEGMLEAASFSPREISIIRQAIFEHRNISQNMSFLGERLHRADNLSRVCSECPEIDNCCNTVNKESGAFLLVY